MKPVKLVRIDGLVWCAECRRAVTRGWPHDRNCQEGHWGECEWTAKDAA